MGCPFLFTVPFHFREVVGELSVCCIPMKSLESHVHKYSRQNDLNIYYYPPDIESGQFDIGVLASFGKMLPKDLIEKFPL